MKAITYFHIRNTPGFQSILFNLGMIDHIILYINNTSNILMALLYILLYIKIYSNTSITYFKVTSVPLSLTNVEQSINN